MTPQELEQKIKDTQGILVYFKNDFCTPCKALRPKVSDLMETAFPHMEMVVVDTVTHPELAGKYNVFGNPTILVFFEGREYIRKSKYISMPEMQGEVERLYNMVFEA